MSKCRILTAQATLAVSFGLVQVLAPARIMAATGITADAALVIGARYVGVCALGIGLISWFARRPEDSAFGRRAIQSLPIVDAFGLALAVLAQLSGVLNAAAWDVVAMWLVVTIGMAYCHFAWRLLKRRPQLEPGGTSQPKDQGSDASERGSVVSPAILLSLCPPTRDPLGCQSAPRRRTSRHLANGVRWRSSQGWIAPSCSWLAPGR